MEKFRKLGLKEKLVGAIEKLGFNEPTEIQKKAIPHLIGGKDVIGESATGSGKTLAFGSAIIDNVVPGEGLQGLVLAPTRELAEQVKNDIKDLSYNNNINIISIYGGVSIKPQIENLRKADVVVATPGRLLDHFNRGNIQTSKMKVLVLDEADRMLDMGFIDDVEKIIKKCPKDRKTLFFSATISSKIKELANKHMKDHIELSGEKQVDPEKLKQIFYDTDKNMKLALIVHLLKKEDTDLVMVFCNTRRTTDFVAKNLKNQGINAMAIHGGFSQNKRDKSINSFNNSDSKTEVLVCTDVAARGWDIDNVSHIYNFDIPRDPNDYVHRIGRTARAGEEGMVVNLLSSEDYQDFRKIDEGYSDFNIKREKKPFVKKINIVSGKSGGKGNKGWNKKRGNKGKGNKGWNKKRGNKGKGNKGWNKKRGNKSNKRRKN